MKRLLALLAGGLGLRAFLRRRAQPSLSPSPADDLRARLAVARVNEPLNDPPPTAPDTEVVPAEATDVDARRADVHARARQAIDDLGDDAG
jgi:hypothetical protein